MQYSSELFCDILEKLFLRNICFYSQETFSNILPSIQWWRSVKVVERKDCVSVGNEERCKNYAGLFWKKDSMKASTTFPEFPTHNPNDAAAILSWKNKLARMDPKTVYYPCPFHHIEGVKCQVMLPMNFRIFCLSGAARTCTASCAARALIPAEATKDNVQIDWSATQPIGCLPCFHKYVGEYFPKYS